MPLIFLGSTSYFELWIILQELLASLKTLKQTQLRWNIICFATSTEAVDGLWSCWGSWSSCGASMKRHRTRRCNNPAPLKGGQPCSGPDRQEEACHISIFTKYCFYFIFQYKEKFCQPYIFAAFTLTHGHEDTLLLLYNSWLFILTIQNYWTIWFVSLVQTGDLWQWWRLHDRLEGRAATWCAGMSAAKEPWEQLPPRKTRHTSWNASDYDMCFI